MDWESSTQRCCCCIEALAVSTLNAKMEELQIEEDECDDKEDEFDDE